jgi:hypothetical protein
MEIQKRPPCNVKTLTMALWEAVPEVQERPPSNVKTSMADPLGGGAGDPGASIINRENVNDDPLRRRCRRSESAHHPT